MMRRLACLALATALGGCASSTSPKGTLAELRSVEPEIEDVRLDDSLDLAAQSYRRYLQETPVNEMTPEAMRRLADLQIEKQFGIIGGGPGENTPAARIVEMAAPESAGHDAPEFAAAARGPPVQAEDSESDREFEARAAGPQAIGSSAARGDVLLPDGSVQVLPTGPAAAIATYEKILELYPRYERNDQVLYQMSRAYDELGRVDEAMQVMGRLIGEYPYSKYVDEVLFRRGEYYFVRKQYLDAEESYTAIVDLGSASSYYELALYKLGWSLYKQELYEEALQYYLAMLDYRLSVGYDFDQVGQEEDERIADTFRVISLSFSNLGGPEVIDEYFARFGHKSYADRLYSNLGEFYLGKLRYQDAAAVYASFIEQNPFHARSPHFSMRIVEIYEQGGFPQLVVEAKKEFASRYALGAEYWSYFDKDESPDVLALLKTNLTDLANYYHARYQDAALEDEKPASFAEAAHWYREFLASFPADPESPSIDYQLADLLLENGNFGEAAAEYERTAYDYGPHERAAAAGYAAVYAHRENLKIVTGAAQLEAKRATVASSLRFAETFPEHEEAPVVLGAAADDLYAMKEFEPAITAARKLIERYPHADPALVRSAWVVVANSSIDTAAYPEAEHAYTRVLELTDAGDESRPALIDSLAAAIYKQGEQANVLGDFRTAATHFLRIRDVAPTSTIRSNAEYDAAAALIKLEDWSAAAGVLEEFRTAFPKHELSEEATRQLAFVYREEGELARSAAEHERIAAETDDQELARQAILAAGKLYADAGDVDNTLRLYLQYADEFPRPLDVALEMRTNAAEIFASRNDTARYHEELKRIVALDAAAGGERSDRTRYLAAHAALVLAEQRFEAFAKLELVQPFEKSLAEKQRRMDAAMAALDALVKYEVADVTAAATYYMAETYYAFSDALVGSERPANLTAAEREDYELAIEEQAYPFEERAIQVHEANHELLLRGVFNPWVQKSLDRLAAMVPGRYAKNEISSGFLGSIDSYAYRMPSAPPIGPEDPAVGPAGDAQPPDVPGVSRNDDIPAPGAVAQATVAGASAPQAD